MADVTCCWRWGQVLGLTVLAWGNSVGDMSTNCAMARKGLANMAMTACYAGPVFNLLVRMPAHTESLRRGSRVLTT
jgi:sodium/potassium/calcium exchanger 6